MCNEWTTLVRGVNSGRAVCVCNECSTLAGGGNSGRGVCNEGPLWWGVRIVGELCVL